MRRLHVHKAVLALGDAVVVWAALWWAFARVSRFDLPLALCLIPLVFAWGFAAQIWGLYKINVFRHPIPQLPVLVLIPSITSTIFSTVLLILSPRAFCDDPYMSLEMAASVSISTALWRLVIFAPLFSLLKRIPKLRRRALVVGVGRVAERFGRGVESDRGLGIDLLGFVLDAPDAPVCVDSSRVLGDVAQLGGLVERLAIDEVIVALPEGNPGHVFECADLACETRARVSVHSNVLAVVLERRFSEEYAGGAVITVRNRPAPFATRFVKRAVDVVLGVIALALTLPLWCAVAVAIKITSKGPVLFVQERVGRGGRPFRCYKFRSMYADGDERVHAEYMQKMITEGRGTDGGFKMRRDPRVTIAGRWLRASSLDELPQLINVLRGEMSLVGPRPPIPYEVSLYKGWQKRRLRGRPGITGFWQVVARSEVPFEDICALDIFYLENVAPWLDLEIMARTIPVVLLRKGAR